METNAHIVDSVRRKKKGPPESNAVMPSSAVALTPDHPVSVLVRANAHNRVPGVLWYERLAAADLRWGIHIPSHRLSAPITTPCRAGTNLHPGGLAPYASPPRPFP